MRISYANVASTLALVVALSGSAYAVTQLPHNSVGSAQLRKNAVSSKAVKNHSLKAMDLGEGQAAVALAGTPMSGGLSGTFPNPTVNVGALTGVVKGSRLSAAVTVPAGPAAVPVLAVPGMGTVKATCLANVNDRSLTITLADVPATFDYVGSQGSASPASFITMGGTANGGNSVLFLFTASPSLQDSRTLRLVVVDGGPVTELDVLAQTNVTGGACRVAVIAQLPA